MHANSKFNVGNILFNLRIVLKLMNNAIIISLLINFKL